MFFAGFIELKFTVFPSHLRLESPSEASPLKMTDENMLIQGFTAGISLFCIEFLNFRLALLLLSLRSLNQSDSFPNIWLFLLNILLSSCVVISSWIHPIKVATTIANAATEAKHFSEYAFCKKKCVWTLVPERRPEIKYLSPRIVSSCARTYLNTRTDQPINQSSTHEAELNCIIIPQDLQI